MATIVNKLNIEPIRELRVIRELQKDGTTYEYYVLAGYKINTDDEPIIKDKTFGPLVGPNKTRAEALFTTLSTLITTREGV